MESSNIILGNGPSSGSTLLVSLIGKSKNIFQTEELYIFDKPDWVTGRCADLKENWATHHSTGYPAHFAHESPLVFPVENPKLDFAQHCDDYIAFFMAHMDALAQSHGCERWVEKTPTNIFALPHLSRAMPDTKFVIIVRHPAAVMRSLAKRKMNPFIAAARWYFPTLIAANLKDRDNILVLKYEALTGEPDASLRKVFDFIGEPFLADYLEPAKTTDTGLASWDNTPTGSIKKNDDFSIIIDGCEARYLSTIKANSYFLKYTQITTAFNVKELCDIFGYTLDFDFSNSHKALALLHGAKAFVQYFVKAKRAGRPIRKLWFDVF